MTIREAITQTDKLLVNAIDDETKLKWLKDIEEKIYKEVVLTHAFKVPNTNFDNDDNTLIAPSPYDNLYISYLMAKIFEYTFETVRYNNAMVIFNQEYQEFCNFYNRTKMPL